MEFEPIATGYYLEALCIDRDTVWVSDVVDGGIRRVTPGGALPRYLPDRQWIGGLLLNHDGTVLVSGPGGIVWINPQTGASGVLLDTLDTVPLGGVNEMLPDGKGGLYCGTVDLPAIIKGERPGPASLLHLAADGYVTRLAEGLVFSNGLGLSPDGRRLYHNESFVGSFAYDLMPDGSITNRTLLLEKPDCDGLAVDVNGHIWISGFGSSELLRLLPDGSVAERLPVPGHAATNIGFGGDDGRDLYVTTVTPEAAAALAAGEMPSEATSLLHRGRVDVAGMPVGRTGFRLA